MTEDISDLLKLAREELKKLKEKINKSGFGFLHEKTNPEMTEKESISQDNLKFVLIIHKKTGLVIHEKDFYGIKFGPDFIHGLFKEMEIDESRKKFLFNDFIIRIEENDDYRMFFILSAEPTELLNEKFKVFLIEFAKAFPDPMKSPIRD